MTLTEPEIFARLTALHSALVEKLGAQPFIAPSISLYGSEKCQISIYSTHADYQRNIDIIHRATAATVAACLADAEAFVAAMPDPTSKAKHDWHRDLAKVIDKGHALALPDDVMQPLQASSQAMHKNLLAAPEAAE